MHKINDKYHVMIKYTFEVLVFMGTHEIWNGATQNLLNNITLQAVTSTQFISSSSSCR